MSIFVLGIDPGFASSGYAVVGLLPEKEVVCLMGVIRTEKSDAKRAVLASDDNLRRARSIYNELERLCGVCGVVRVICAESMSFPRNASAAAKVAMCWGLIAALSQARGIPIVQVTPKQLKKALCQDGSASKEQVQEALRMRYNPQVLDDHLARVPRGQEEHPYDALAAVVACLDSDPIRMARKMVT